jgi:hypothetical protein
MTNPGYQSKRKRKADLNLFNHIFGSNKSKSGALGGL